jgi:hypothetical protein
MIPERWQQIVAGVLIGLGVPGAIVLVLAY